MSAATTPLLVAIGGALGASARSGCTHGAIELGVDGWCATLAVNLVACFAIGWVFLVLEARYRESGPTRVRSTSHFTPLRDRRWFRDDDASALVLPEERSNARLRAFTAFWITGVLGGFSTFSTFSLDVVLLLGAEDWAAAATNVVASVVSCGLGVAVGMFLARGWLLRPAR